MKFATMDSSGFDIACGLSNYVDRDDNLRIPEKRLGSEER